MLKHLDLFSGIGGFALACQWAGIETIGFVEIDKYCQKVLRKYWPNVPIVEDIRNVEEIKQIVANAAKQPKREPEHEGNAKPINRQAWQISGNRSTNTGTGITISKSPAILITAGFPCQPFSVAGKRQGERDDRYLWPETLAVIEAVKPKWVLLENVTGIINLALDTVLSDLEGAGYSTETLIIPACAVNAWHRRDRVWIIAHSERTGTWQDNGGIRQGISEVDGRQESIITDPRLLRQTKRQKQATGIKQYSEGVTPNSSSNRLERQKPVCETQQTSSGFRYSGENWWTVEPELGRVAHGIPHRVDRLKCLGNAIVPQVAYEIIKAIKEVMELRI